VRRVNVQRLVVGGVAVAIAVAIAVAVAITVAVDVTAVARAGRQALTGASPPPLVR
jgi:hypothetical protein